MANNAVFDTLVSIPMVLSTARGGIRMLLEQSGYSDLHDEITEGGLREALSRHPECVDSWMSYSEDKRADSGWYIKQDGGRFMVGYLSRTRRGAAEMSYDDRISACAAFVKHELEDIRART